MSMYEYGDYEYMMDSVGVIAGVMLLFMAFALIWGVAAYVLQSVGYYTIAKRREIRHPWMAWVPVCSTYLLGCISDHYQHVVNKRATKRRIALLVLVILNAVLAVWMQGLSSSLIADMSVGIVGGGYVDEDAMIQQMVGPMMSILGVSLLVCVVSIVLAVFQYIALYDLYASCWPNCKVGFLLLSIFLGVSTPILIFICRNRDEGMKRPEYPMYPNWTPPQQPQAPEQTPPQPAPSGETDPWE